MTDLSSFNMPGIIYIYETVLLPFLWTVFWDMCRIFLAKHSPQKLPSKKESDQMLEVRSSCIKLGLGFLT